MNKKIELKVINISNSQAQACACAMVLQEINGERQIPIIIGASEAQAITLKLKNIRPPRPLTHDLFNTTLKIYNISIHEVLIHKAHEGVFYSYIYFKQGNEITRIDARTSDAIALAVRFGCPIFIYESILEKEYIKLNVENKEIEEKEDEQQHIEAAPLPAKNLKTLKAALEKAIQDENYELASILRDEILRRQ